MAIKSKPDPLFLTPAEAAGLLRVDIRTIYNWLRSGEVQAVRFGKMWRIRRDDLLKKT